MQNSIKAQIETLVKLQEIDTETKRIELMIAGLPDIYAELESRLNEVELGLNKEEIMIVELKKKYRMFESDTQMNASMIQKSEEKLRSVKTNKEYQSILKEIDDLKSKNSKIEDEMLQHLDHIEQVEKDLVIRKKEYAEVSEQIGREKEAIDREAKAAEEKYRILKADWEAIADTVKPDMLSLFLKVRGKTGTAVVPVIDAVCQGCHLNIPPQMYNELQRNDSLRFCPHCQRIIFWKKIDDPV